ncbi:hypothetical protein OURE66S_01201 [Oligella ureolytica]
MRDRPVTLGQDFAGRTHVVSGVEAGEQVIVEGFTKIRAGQPVRPQPFEKAPDTADDLMPVSETSDSEAAAQ